MSSSWFFFPRNQTEHKKRKNLHCSLVVFPGFPISVEHGELVLICEERRDHRVSGSNPTRVRSVRTVFCRFLHFSLSLSLSQRFLGLVLLLLRSSCCCCFLLLGLGFFFFVGFKVYAIYLCIYIHVTLWFVNDLDCETRTWKSRRHEP